jgi:ABC-type transporter MlaC component
MPSNLRFAPRFGQDWQPGALAGRNARLGAERRTGAKTLVDKTVAEINATSSTRASPSKRCTAISKSCSPSYADVPTIARSVLGRRRKSASKGQMSGYTKAFQGYISRKYGRRFREFIGGRIEVPKPGRSKATSR